MDNKYFAELARRLNEDGISTGEKNDNRLQVLLHGKLVINVTQSGDVLLMPEASGNQEAGELYHEVSRLACAVKEYTQAIERAPVLQARALDEPFRLLADFNGVVLAAYEMEKGRGYKFATWNWDYDRKGVNRGEYFINGYEAAKKDFAVRSGLLQKERQFTDEQLTELYRSDTQLTKVYRDMECLAEDVPELTPQQEEALCSARKQIEQAVPDLLERLEQGQVQEQTLDM